MDYLDIHDSRTGTQYRVAVEDNCVKGQDLAQIRSMSTEGHMQSLRVFDLGFVNTAIMHSSVARGNGTINRLEFRGRNVYDLVEHHDFEEVAYLLIWNRIPNAEEKIDFRTRLAQKALEVPEHVADVVRSYPQSSPHMTIMIGALSAALAGKPSMIPAIYGQHVYSKDLQAADNSILEVIATYSVCLGLTYAHKTGATFNKPEIGESYIHNVFSMMGLCDPSTGKPDPAVLSIMQKWMIVSADHELAHSTCATLLAGSAHADPLSCVIAGITSGYGTLHLGATQSAYVQQANIGRPEKVAQVVAECKAGQRRLMGVGHRVYKSQNDPRLVIVKKLLNDLRALGKADPLIDVSYELERQVNADPFFANKSLFINFDLYWWGLYTALGIDINAVVPFFFASRVCGMMAHWRELMTQNVKLWRPNMIYRAPTVESDGDGGKAKTSIAKVDSKTDLTEDATSSGDEENADLCIRAPTLGKAV